MEGCWEVEFASGGEWALLYPTSRGLELSETVTKVLYPTRQSSRDHIRDTGSLEWKSLEVELASGGEWGVVSYC
jgi:hypothetical protein